TIYWPSSSEPGRLIFEPATRPCQKSSAGFVGEIDGKETFEIDNTIYDYEPIIGKSVDFPKGSGVQRISTALPPSSFVDVDSGDGFAVGRLGSEEDGQYIVSLMIALEDNQAEINFNKPADPDYQYSSGLSGFIDSFTKGPRTGFADTVTGEGDFVTTLTYQVDEEIWLEYNDIKVSVFDQENNEIGEVNFEGFEFEAVEQDNVCPGTTINSLKVQGQIFGDEIVISKFEVSPMVTNINNYQNPITPLFAVLTDEDNNVLYSTFVGEVTQQVCGDDANMIMPDSFEIELPLNDPDADKFVIEDLSTGIRKEINIE
ncbi:hypothetical protein ACFLZB_04965, partial [Nanoarchaeota archaeon]